MAFWTVQKWKWHENGASLFSNLLPLLFSRLYFSCSPIAAYFSFPNAFLIFRFHIHFHALARTVLCSWNEWTVECVQSSSVCKSEQKLTKRSPAVTLFKVAMMFTDHPQFLHRTSHYLNTNNFAASIFYSFPLFLVIVMPWPISGMKSCSRGNNVLPSLWQCFPVYGGASQFMVVLLSLWRCFPLATGSLGSRCAENGSLCCHKRVQCFPPCRQSFRKNVIYSRQNWNCHFIFWFMFFVSTLFCSNPTFVF
jgi:hypothetical protein